MLVLRRRELPRQGSLELFIRRHDAERFVEDVRDDEPELGELLSVEPVELAD